MNIILIIYLLGITPAYFMGKAAHNKSCNIYTKGERIFIMTTCLLSWVAFIIFFITWGTYMNFKKK